MRRYNRCVIFLIIITENILRDELKKQNGSTIRPYYRKEDEKEQKVHKRPYISFQYMN